MYTLQVYFKKIPQLLKRWCLTSHRYASRGTPLPLDWAVTENKTGRSSHFK